MRQRLAPGGVFAFSQAEPGDETYGLQRMRGKWLEGRERELTVVRRQYAHERWADLLKRHGFNDVDARVISAPDPSSGLGTLMVRAQVSSSSS